ncbi:hypothetical protein G6O69_37460 [Pseudenhygromyxa sp. WMMC2535]|uniref:O-antigen ligase family protein n=1 Tax=Pseudenhygromyxa sp. WMMC2535 TaxID=2712867 RepID=UPI001554125F|nr:O-antigen ligase family protein [Pseudenhygromyxa sp. WMMC2535]NVB37195.1 hypothetical protein [Pseudenhygromyxa sp. WMMC2535]NVB43564.1 hypothetical protein [Pseudenhygromyxa sp. WMMC2535]
MPRRLPQRAPSATAPARGRRARRWDRLLFALMATGGVVFFEPAPFDLLAVLLLAAALLARRVRLDTSILLPSALLGLFLLANAFSLPAVTSLNVALRFAAITLYLLALWLGLVGLIHDESQPSCAPRIHAIMGGWSVAMVGCGVLGVATSLGLLPLGELMLHNGRLNGLFKDGNVFGAWSVPIAVYALARLMALHGRRRWWWLGCLLVAALVILLTYSRGAWINFALSAAVFFALRLLSVGSPRAKLITMIALPVAIVALAAALFEVLSLDAVQDMLAMRLKMQSYDTHRFATQEEALLTSLEHPLGIGPGQSEHTFGRATHSTYVRTLIENGFLGLLSLTAFMVLSGARAAWYAIDAADDEEQLLCAAIAAGIVGLLVESLVIDSIHWRHAFVILALAWMPLRGGALRRRAGQGHPSHGGGGRLSARS